MKYSIGEICLILKALKQSSPFPARKTWYILRSSSHLDKTALKAEKLDVVYVKYASSIKSWSKTTHFKGGSREAYRVLRPIKRDRVLHRHVQYAWNMPFSPDHETRLLDIEFDRSKICSIIFYSRWTKLVNRNMKLHNVSHNRSLSQIMSAVSCIPFIFMTIDMSSSSRIEKLPSSYSSESAEWKVLHEKKKKNGRCPFLHLVNFTEFCPSYISCYSVSSGGICQNRIPGICLVNLSWSYTFLSWLCHGYLSPLNVSW